MAFIRTQQDLISPKLGEEFYIGTVVDNNDPTQHSRIKIRIQELHGTDQDIPDSNLPWAIQMRPTFLGANTNLSTTAIPRIGSKVILTHIRGDIYQPSYLFELSEDSSTIDKGQEDYPDSYALKDSDGNFWHVNLVQNKLDILFNGSKVLQITENSDTIIGQNKTETVQGNESTTINGSRTELIEQGTSKTNNANETITIAGNRNEDIGGTHIQTVTSSKTVNANRLIINTTADVDINAAANVTINGSEIHLNGSGGGVLTQESINPLTGTPFPDGSTTVKAGDG